MDYDRELKKFEQQVFLCAGCEKKFTEKQEAGRKLSRRQFARKLFRKKVDTCTLMVLEFPLELRERILKTANMEGKSVRRMAIEIFLAYMEAVKYKG